MAETNMCDASAAKPDWKEVATEICRAPESTRQCPICDDGSVTGEWNVVDLATNSARVELSCCTCGAEEGIEIVLPEEAPWFYPMDRYPHVAAAINREVESIGARVREHASVMPVAAFTTHPLWEEAGWSATTYKWHPTSEAPPIMGLEFSDEEKGLEIFREAERQINHEDRFEEIRVAIIEGAVPGQEERPGYSVHICADPEALAAHATMNELVVDPTIVPFLGQWNRHYPILGQPSLLTRFKQEFEKHQEFLLTPVVTKPDGNQYMVPELGIIKNVIHFRQLEEITTGDDPDAAALLLPQLITAPP